MLIGHREVPPFEHSARVYIYILTDCSRGRTTRRNRFRYDITTYNARDWMHNKFIQMLAITAARHSHGAFETHREEFERHGYLDNSICSGIRTRDTTRNSFDYQLPRVQCAPRRCCRFCVNVMSSPLVRRSHK